MSPADFIAILEDSNLIGPVGEWVLRTACAQARVWMDMPGAPDYVSVNLSAQQLHRDHTFSRTIREVLTESDLAPGSLQLEVTEGMLVEDIHRNTEFFAELAATGVRLAIDDFGTGYSSLSYLKRFSVDTIKIDRSFIRGIPGDMNDTAIVDAVIAMATRLGIAVVAEGVETEQQLAMLRDRQCAQIQGFLISPPVPADQVPALLRPSALSAAGRD
jgi:EAL domain-containing protein (putative c-di-GMP-specific phosphodiesterase class I)